jgi:hypothetical protein
VFYLPPVYGYQPEVLVASKCYHSQCLCEQGGNIGQYVGGGSVGWQMHTKLTTQGRVLPWQNPLVKAVAENGLLCLWWGDRREM